MASPFRYFRKNQKVMLAVIGILSMFAFVFIGPWSGMGKSSSAANTDPEVFSWKFGSVKSRELTDRLRLRRSINLFLKNCGTLAGTPPQLIMSALFEPETEQGIVYEMLLQKKAEEMGIVVSDGMVNRYIADVTNDKLRPDQLREILRSQTGLSQTELFDGLRNELQAKYADMAYSPLFSRYRQMGGMQFFVFTGDTPGDRWQYFCRLNREVTSEIMPVKVADFVSEVADPTPEQLRSFYDQYKNDYPYYNQYPWPELPTPGFKRPFKAQFQYVKSDYEKQLAVEEPKVTEQEIFDYYEKNKDNRFRKTKLPELPGKKTGDEAEKPAGESTDQTPMTEGKGGDSKATDANAPGAKSSEKSVEPSSEKKSETSKENSNDQKSDSKSGAKTDGKSAPKSSAGKSDAKSKDGKAKPGDGKQSSLTKPHSLDGELLAMADEAATQLDSSKNAAKSAATDKKSADTAATASKPDDEKSSAEKSTDGKPAAEPPVEYEPLEKVLDTIRKSIARERIEERAGAEFDGIERQLEDYRIKLDRYRANVTTNKNVKKPEPPALADLVKDSPDLEAKETELISDRQAYNDTDVGKSRRMITPGNFDTPSFIQTAFNPALKFYKADRSDDNDNNRYLWWKIADEPAHVPTLEEIKPDVVQAWKLIQARKPAMAKAEEDAAQARKLKQTLKETFGSNAEVSTIGPFSWYSRNVTQPFGLPRRTDVKGIDQGGDPFLKAVFALDQGQTGVAPNEPQNIYYVVQIESEKPTLEEMHQQFMTAMSNLATSLPYAGIGWQENQGLGFAWAKELENEYDFKMNPNRSQSQPVSEEY